MFDISTGVGVSGTFDFLKAICLTLRYAMFAIGLQPVETEDTEMKRELMKQNKDFLCQATKAEMLGGVLGFIGNIIMVFEVDDEEDKYYTNNKLECSVSWAFDMQPELTNVIGFGVGGAYYFFLESYTWYQWCKSHNFMKSAKKRVKSAEKSAKEKWRSVKQRMTVMQKKVRSTVLPGFTP